MTRERKRKRRHNSYRDMALTDTRLTETLERIKKPRLSSDSPTDDLGEIGNIRAEAGSSEQAHSPTGNENGWQTVESKSRRHGIPRGPVNTKHNYPEIVLHGRNLVPIRLADLQQLILYIFADGVAINWLAVRHSHCIRKIVVFMVPGLEKGMFDGSFDFGEQKEEAVNGHVGKKMVNNATSVTAETSKVENCLQKESLQRKEGKRTREQHGYIGNPFEMKKETLPVSLQSITSIFSQVWLVRAPGDSKYGKLHSSLQGMLIAPLPASKLNKDPKGQQSLMGEHAFRAVRTPVKSFILSASELREADYPIHPAAFTSKSDAVLEAERREQTNQSTSAGWVDTAVASSKPLFPPECGIESGSLTEGLKVYCLDCEMVVTTDDAFSLARISLVDWSGNPILDSYVKPPLPIKEYNTQYSGITPAHLEHCTTTLADIQKKLSELIGPESIICGHSLESDLCALKMTHPFIIDTALLYPHPRGLPLRQSLKFLTQRYLKREIQTQSSGHDSIEDARAVLDLVKLKCENGPKWGTSEANGEPLFRRLARAKVKGEGGIRRARTSAIVDYGTPERGFGKEADIKIGASSDDEVVEGVSRCVRGDEDGKLVPGEGVDFTWGRLRELESWRGWSTNNRDYAVADKLHGGSDGRPNAMDTSATHDGASNAESKSNVTLLTKVGETISRLSIIYDDLPKCTLFIVYSGTGDPREVGRLQKMQTQYRLEYKVKKWDDLSVKWTDTEEQALRRAVDRARDGCGFICIK